MYRAVSGQSLVEVVNYAEIDQDIFFEEPMNVVEFKTTQHFELHNIEEKKNDSGSIPLHKMRTEHLNKEELKELLRICKKYPGVFHNVAYWTNLPYQYN